MDSGSEVVSRRRREEDDFESFFAAVWPRAKASFEDPPGIAGDGLPSGGQYPANGVMTYYPGSTNGSWRETCTLPAAEQARCTTVLNDFLGRYGKE